MYVGVYVYVGWEVQILFLPVDTELVSRGWNKSNGDQTFSHTITSILFYRNHTYTTHPITLNVFVFFRRSKHWTICRTCVEGTIKVFENLTLGLYFDQTPTTPFMS